MNLPLLIIGLAGATALAITMLRDATADEPADGPDRLPIPPQPRVRSPGLPTRIPNLPPPTLNPNLLGTLDLKVPPSPWPIPSGTYIESVGWCPPGMVYNMQTKFCEPQISTQGDACCDSCASGGPCSGCGS